MDDGEDGAGVNDSEDVTKSSKKLLNLFSINLFSIS